MDKPTETFSDRLLGFTLPARNARARAVRLDTVVDEVLSAHDYPPPVAHLLGEALVLAVLMGGLLKAEGADAQMTIQAQSQAGIVSLLVCDYHGGNVRGYADFDAERLTALGANSTLSSLFEGGYLAITFETGKKKRYQGIVPLEGETLAEVCQTYFSQSEQLPTLIRIASQANGEGHIAAGLLIQHLADGEEGRERLHVRMDHPDWEHIVALASTISHEELLDSGLSLEGIAWRLFHEEEQIRVQQGTPIARKCRCNPEYYRSVISRFPEAERDEMRNDEGMIIVDCAFCAGKYEISI